MTLKRCSLCDLELDSKGKPARVRTRGGWVAHEECVAYCPEIRAEPDAAVGMSGSIGILPGGFFARLLKGSKS